MAPATPMSRGSPSPDVSHRRENSAILDRDEVPAEPQYEVQPPPRVQLLDVPSRVLYDRAPPTGLEIREALDRSIYEKEHKKNKDKVNDLSGGQTQTNSRDEFSSDDITIAENSLSWRRLPSRQAWMTYLTQEVAGDRYLEFQLLLMTVVTGALDAMTYTTYSVFTTKQTGNALFLALYAFRSPAIGEGTEYHVGISMGVFFIGALFWGQLGRWSRQRRRIWLVLSQLFQALSILGATAARYWSTHQRHSPSALGVLTLLSFAMSGQIATALNVNMPELNTTMITGALVSLASDPQLFKLRNWKRTRRLLFFASIEAGSFIGAALLNFRSPTATILVCACIKFLIVFSFLFNRGIVRPRGLNLEDGRKWNRSDGAVTPVSRILWGD